MARTRMTLAWWTLGLAGLTLTASGCPDSEARFNEFLEATKDMRQDAGDDESESGNGDGDGDGDPADTIPDMSGTFLFALETALGPGLPLQFVTNIDMTVNEDGSGAVASMSFQPLSLEQGETLMPRECIGEPLVFTDVAFDASGAYVLDMGEVMVTGMANPVTGGDIVATLVVSGEVVHEDAICGTFDAMLTSPLESPLTGSTFAAIRLDDDGCTPTTLPTMFPYKCADVPPPDAPEFPDINGTFLFALETALGPGLPLQFATTVEFDGDPDGTGGVASFTFQPLSLDQGATLTPRMFIGDSLTYSDVEIDADGNYTIDMGEVMVTGMANPVTGGDIVATIVVSGNVLDMDNLCGTFDGELTSPLVSPLDGSTFAAIRLADDGSNPDTLPTEFPVACP